MMQREQVTEDIFIFTSDLYVHVTAGIIVTEERVDIFAFLAGLFEML